MDKSLERNKNTEGQNELVCVLQGGKNMYENPFYQFDLNNLLKKYYVYKGETAP